MVSVKARIRQWGSSLGIILPKDKVKEAGLRKDQEIIVEVKSQAPLKNAFGSLKEWKIDSQKVKDKLRKEWSRW